MKHPHPPEDLPVVPEPSENEPKEDVHFRDQEQGDTMLAPKSLPRDEPSNEGVPARSLQSKNQPMSKHETATEPQLLGVQDVADRLGTMKYTVYRLVEKRKIAFHRVGTVLRFRAEDIERYLTACRVEPRRIPYGRT